MKIGCTTSEYVTRFGHEVGLKYLADGGIDALDYGFFSPKLQEVFKLDDEAFAAHFAEVKAVCDKLGLMVGQLHSPMPSYTGNEEKDAEIFEIQRRSIVAAGLLGSKYIIIHPCIPRVYKYTTYREETKKINMDFYSRLMPTAEEYGVKICLENMFNGDAKHPAGYCICPTVISTSWEMKDYFKSLAAPNLFAYCLDIGHGNLTGSSPEQMIYDLGDNLETLHVHDNDGTKDMHECPYRGNINWDKVMTALRDVRYNGVFNFEADTHNRMYINSIPDMGPMILAKMGRYLVSKMEKVTVKL